MKRKEIYSKLSFNIKYQKIFILLSQEERSVYEKLNSIVRSIKQKPSLNIRLFLVSDQSHLNNTSEPRCLKVGKINFK